MKSITFTPDWASRKTLSLISTLYDVITSLQVVLHVCCSLKFVNFGLMIIVLAEYNQVSPGSGSYNLLFFGLVRVGAKDNGALQGRGAKNLALQDSNLFRQNNNKTVASQKTCMHLFLLACPFLLKRQIQFYPRSLVCFQNYIKKCWNKTHTSILCFVFFGRVQFSQLTVTVC